MPGRIRTGWHEEEFPSGKVNNDMRSCKCFLLVAAVVLSLLLTGGCIKPKITLFPDGTEPLEESVLQGRDRDKILVIPVKGILSESPSDRLLRRRPGTVQEVVARLKKAEKDKRIKAVILKIDSPGGSVTASDILYHEIVQYRERTRAVVVAVLMSVATSGAYYVSLPADFILAHPTTVTGSVGVIFLQPKVDGLMDKIGLAFEVEKSGRNKDMGSPFRRSTEEEQQILQGLINEMGGKFMNLVAAHRRLDEKTLADVSTARIYLADEALRLNLVDRIGYLDDAVEQAKRLAELSRDPKIIAYRRAEYPDDNIYNYNASAGRLVDGTLNPLEWTLAESIPPMRSGFYYLWLPGSGGD